MFNTLQKPVQVCRVRVLGTPQDLTRLDAGLLVQCQQYAMKRHSLVRSHHYTLAQRFLEGCLHASNPTSDN